MRYIFCKFHVSKSIVDNFKFWFSFPRLGYSSLWDCGYVQHSDEYIRKKLDESPIDSILSASLECLMSDAKSFIDNYLFDQFKDIGNPVIVLHTRSSFYHSDGNRRNRNMSLVNYLSSIQFLIDQGFCVVLCGDRHNLILPAGVIDLTRDDIPAKTRELLLVLYISKAFLYIGTQSGPVDLAYLFTIPCLLLNCIDVTHVYAYRSPNINIIKPIKPNISLVQWIDLMPYDILQNLNSIADSTVYGSYNDFELDPELIYSVISSIVTPNNKQNSLFNSKISDQKVLAGDRFFHLDRKLISDKFFELVRTWDSQINAMPGYKRILQTYMNRAVVRFYFTMAFDSSSWYLPLSKVD